ncbi:hypothetical protein GCM10008090_19990 [Arenicella chitinivorans]|uniref:Tetratricopeptide repeat protein n=2 Tax=Arenicella chitinivorans TaxID=1329800 RepID=A0A918VMZ1_9GAMM|nr:hypothetical protein GCM10008090_19990 [Arenicella chitinivorans]
MLCAMLCVSVSAQAEPPRQPALAASFANYFNARDHAQMDRLFDTDAFCARVANWMHDGTAQQVLFKLRTCGVYKKRSFSNMLFAQAYATNPVAKYIGQTKQGRPVIRLVIDGGGYEYIELLVRDSEFGGEKSARIHDLMFASKGQFHSKSTATTMGLFGEVSANTMKRLLGIDDVDNDVVAVFTKMAEAGKRGDFAASLQLLDTLPEGIRTTKVILLLRAGYAMQTSEVLYRDALSELNQHFGDDPTLDFALLDHHFYQNDYQKAYACVESIERRYGSDASVLNLKANVMSVLERMDEAFETIDTALVKEPELADLYTTKLYMLTFEQRHQDMLDLIKLAKQYGVAVQLGASLSDTVFDEFRASEVYEDWVDQAVYGVQEPQS